jgi:hypothetical protein
MSARRQVEICRRGERLSPVVGKLKLQQAFGLKSVCENSIARLSPQSLP